MGSTLQLFFLKLDSAFGPDLFEEVPDDFNNLGRSVNEVELL